jgi:hypothetical protein
MCTQIHCSTLNIDGSIYITLSTICCKMTESSAKDPERCKCKKINGDNACPPTTTPGIVASFERKKEMLRRSLVSSTGLSSKSSKAVIDALAKNGGSAAEKQ